MSQNPSAVKTPVITLNQVTKRYPGIIANHQIDLTLWPGEVQVLLGENGAGKSTLVAMLSGLQQPDEGYITVDGQIQSVSSPRRAHTLGIGTVFQHAMMVPGLSIVDNIALGDTWWRRPARHRYAQRINDLARDIGVTVNPFARAGSLSLGEQQQAEIIRTLLRGSRILILDEATAMLTPDDAQELGQLMRRLVAQGLAVVFITHKLNEALNWGDRISVLRRGRKVGEITPQRLTSLSRHQATAEIVEMMFDLSARPDSAVLPTSKPSKKTLGEPVLEALAIEVADSLMPLKGIELRVRAGEIVGIAGIDGNGQKQLAEVLAGQRPMTRGRILLMGESIGSCSIGQRRQRGLRYITDDRMGEGTVVSFPVATNLLLKQIGEAPFWRRGFMQAQQIAYHARDKIAEYDIRTPQIDTPVGTLSGGNIQKVLLARELGGQARAVIFAKPTHGLDVQNSQSIRERIRRTAQSGVAVLLISTDLEELLELSDRIAVMSQGTLVGTVDNDSLARNHIGAMMSGAVS